jgi:methionyl-tRNA formyltransferase
MQLVFAGTPTAALPSLGALAASTHEVVAVVTRPDRPAGRGQRSTASPVKQWAYERGVECLQPTRAGDLDFVARLKEIEPDCCPAVAYGALLPSAVLDIPEHGWCNLHFSVLPRWRGAAPVQHALIAGDDVTGATTFRIVEVLDAGPVYGVCTETIRPDDTAGVLLDRLAAAGATLLVATLDAMEAGELRAREQPTDGVTLAPKLTIDDARIDWSAPAFAVDRRIRGCTPDPGAWTMAGELRLRIGPVALRPDAAAGERLAPGEVRVGRREVLVGTATAAVLLGDVQPPGRSMMSAADWARGLRTSVERFNGT